MYLYYRHFQIIFRPRITKHHYHDEGEGEGDDDVSNDSYELEIRYTIVLKRAQIRF